MRVGLVDRCLYLGSQRSSPPFPGPGADVTLVLQPTRSTRAQLSATVRGACGGRAGSIRRRRGRCCSRSRRQEGVGPHGCLAAARAAANRLPARVKPLQRAGVARPSDAASRRRTVMSSQVMSSGLGPESLAGATMLTRRRCERWPPGRGRAALGRWRVPGRRSARRRVPSVGVRGREGIDERGACRRR